MIEAKKAGATLTGVVIQSAKYNKGLPDGLPAWRRPLPFCYQATGKETRFTNGFDPDPRSRNILSFHKPGTLADWLTDNSLSSHSRPDRESGFSNELAAEPETIYRPATFLSRIRQTPPLIEEGLWPAQIVAIKNLEKPLAENHPRALIQMATGSGKTFTAITFLYRLIKFGGAKRVLFLVDRGNLGRQALKEFQQYTSPYNNFKFTEEYIVQRLSSNTLDTTAQPAECRAGEVQLAHAAQEGWRRSVRSLPPYARKPGQRLFTLTLEFPSLRGRGALVKDVVIGKRPAWLKQIQHVQTSCDRYHAGMIFLCIVW